MTKAAALGATGAGTMTLDALAGGPLAALGLVLVERHQVPTARLRYGANARARVAHETVAVPRMPA